jgi:hypothetical protein
MPKWGIFRTTRNCAGAAVVRASGVAALLCRAGSPCPGVAGHDQRAGLSARPAWPPIPLLLLATAAATIASRSIIGGPSQVPNRRCNSATCIRRSPITRNHGFRYQVAVRKGCIGALRAQRVRGSQAHPGDAPGAVRLQFERVDRFVVLAVRPDDEHLLDDRCRA